MIRPVSIQLQSDIVYVTGTVNGLDTTFTLQDLTTEGSIWSADVPRTPNDVYDISVTAVNNVGSQSNFSTVLYYGLHLITDRTYADVERVKYLNEKGIAGMTTEEMEEWLSGMKGCYNASDLNRVESAVQYLLDRLEKVGIFLELETKNTWQTTDWPTSKNMERYLYNLRTVRSALTVPMGTPNVPDTANNLDYEKANDLEKLLEIVDILISNIEQTFLFSGEILSGEV